MRKSVIRTIAIALLISVLLVIPAFAENATVTASDVNFRSGPGTGYSILDCLPKGASVTVTDRSNSSWYAVNYNGRDGFMSSMYLSVQADSGENGGAEVIVVGEAQPGTINAMYVRFRSGPSTDSTILGEYNTGKELSVTGYSGDWTACIINGQAGYVYSQYVTTTKPAVSGTGGSELGRQIAEYALQFVGYNYVWGGTSPSTGFDCSGLMYYVLTTYGYKMNRVANDQMSQGTYVSRSDLQVGDLVFFGYGNYANHVGMYIGGGNFVHASTPSTGVRVNSLNETYYNTRYIGARRII